MKSTGKLIELSDFIPIGFLHPTGSDGLEMFLRNHQVSLEAECIDVGCGIGGISRYLANLGYKVQGIDLLPHFIELAKEIGELLHFNERSAFICVNLTELNPYSNRFGFCTVIGVFMYTQGSDLMKEIFKTMQPGGVMYTEEYFLAKESELTAEESKLLIDYVPLPFRTK